MGSAPALHVEELVKDFEATRALDGVSVAFECGRVHALVGENGAGKSTLGKVVAGAIAPDGGRLIVDGVPVSFRGPRDALAHGIVTISQELALVPTRTVLDNVFVGIEPGRHGLRSRREMRRRFDELCERWGWRLSAATVVRRLGLDDQLKVEFLRALAHDARVVVMDEPTAALAADDTEQVLAAVERLRDAGTTVIFVSHFLREVLRVADTVSVLRNGALIRTAPAAEETPASLVGAMLGRSLGQAFPPRRRPPADAPVVCAVRELRLHPGTEPIDLEVRAGEIVALAGLVGSGRSSVARAIFGAQPAASMELELDGCRVAPAHPADAIAVGMAFVPESRKEQGLLLRRSSRENIVLPHLDGLARTGMVDRAATRAAAVRAIERLSVTPDRPDVEVHRLSGGNQQKVLFGRWVVGEVRLLLVDEPTRGVDIGAKRAIYDVLVELAADGVAVLLVSSDTEEVLGLAHRVLVMRAGAMVAELDGEQATEDDVLRHAFAQPVP
jgi:ABC-type sugar transport system ATPase subunit